MYRWTKQDAGNSWKFSFLDSSEELSTKVEHELQRIDVRKDLPLYRMPSLELLDEYSSQRHEVSVEELYRNENKIRATLAN